MHLGPWKGTHTTATGNGPRGGSPSEPAAETRERLLARPGSTTDTTPSDEQPPEDTHRRGHPWVARISISRTTGTRPEGEVNHNSQSAEEDVIGFGNSWTARFGISWTANTTPEGASNSKNKSSGEDVAGHENQWMARFGVGWKADTPPEWRSNSENKPSEDAFGHKNQWTARLDQPPGAAVPPHRPQWAARPNAGPAGKIAAPRQDGTSKTKRQSPGGDLSGLKDQSPARISAERAAEAGGEQLVDAATRMAAEIEQGRRQLEEMAEQKREAEQSRDLALDAVKRLKTRLDLLSADSRTSEGLAIRASRAEEERRMAYKAAREAERQRQELESKLSDLRGHVSERERKTQLINESLEGEVREYRKRLDKFEAETRKLETQMRTARGKEAEYEQTLEDMQYELDQRQERNRELNQLLASYINKDDVYGGNRS